VTGAAATIHPRESAEPRERWTQLAILGVGMVLAMSPSFAAAAVAPILRDEWTVGLLDLPFLKYRPMKGRDTRRRVPRCRRRRRLAAMP